MMGEDDAAHLKYSMSVESVSTSNRTNELEAQLAMMHSTNDHLKETSARHSKVAEEVRRGKFEDQQRQRAEEQIRSRSEDQDHLDAIELHRSYVEKQAQLERDMRMARELAATVDQDHLIAVELLKQDLEKQAQQERDMKLAQELANKDQQDHQVAMDLHNQEQGQHAQLEQDMRLAQELAMKTFSCPMCLVDDVRSTYYCDGW